MKYLTVKSMRSRQADVSVRFEGCRGAGARRALPLMLAALKSVHLPSPAMTEANYGKMPPELLLHGDRPLQARPPQGEQARALRCATAGVRGKKLIFWDIPHKSD